MSTSGNPARPDRRVASARKGASIWKSAGMAAALAWFSLATPDEGGDGTGLYRPDGTRTPAGDAYRAAS